MENKKNDNSKTKKIIIAIIALLFTYCLGICSAMLINNSKYNELLNTNAQLETQITQCNEKIKEYETPLESIMDAPDKTRITLQNGTVIEKLAPGSFDFSYDSEDLFAKNFIKDCEIFFTKCKQYIDNDNSLGFTAKIKSNKYNNNTIDGMSAMLIIMFNEDNKYTVSLTYFTTFDDTLKNSMDNDYKNSILYTYDMYIQLDSLEKEYQKTLDDLTKKYSK